MKKASALLLLFVLNVSFIAAQSIRGKVSDENGEPIESATVMVRELQKGVSTDSNGNYELKGLPQRIVLVTVSFVGYENNRKEVDLTKGGDIVLNFDMVLNTNLNAIEVFGERFKQPEKLDAITRMPLRPSEQIQSISIISQKMIAQQGVLTVTDAVRNVAGVTLFGSYGGVRESLSIRGYRGVPVLKNGVRVDSDFRTGALASDMSGVESVQVIKGSAAITQGIGNDLGSPGGVINVVTKTPKFVNSGEVTMRVGSWGQVRPTFDVQSVLGEKRTVAMRLNGAYERADGFRKHLSMNRVYINPSLEWRPDSKTRITLELDYLNENKTPDLGTVNLAIDSVEALYKMPRNKFLGFKTDNVNNKTLTYAARVTRELADKLSIRAAYFASSYNVDNTSAKLSSIKGEPYNMKARSIARSLRDDQNSTFQLDFVGQDVYTGSIKHTFQVGFDYRMTNLMTDSYGYYPIDPKTGKRKFQASVPIDVIDVLGSISNIFVMPSAASLGVSKDSLWVLGELVTSAESSYGFMAQEVMTINEYVKAILGLRYSYKSSNDNKSVGQTTGDAWNPMLGIMLTPLKNVNVFGSYTTTTSIRSAANKMSNGEEIGASPTRQYEVGIKSDWLDNRLRFNFTYFDIITKNLSNPEYIPGTNQTTGYYYKAGDLKRNGVEVELNGSVLPNLQVMLGYAYLNARYDNSPSFVNGSSPLNAPKHTANSWIHYTLDRSALKGLSVGVGAYYVGTRPVNDYSLAPDNHGSLGGIKPFDMPAYTTVNVQLAYTYKNLTTQVLFNNIFDEIGYNSYYRGGYINQIDPRNFAAVVAYQF